MSRLICLTCGLLLVAFINPGEDVPRIGNCCTLPNQAECLGGLDLNGVSGGHFRFYRGDGPTELGRFDYLGYWHGMQRWLLPSGTVYAQVDVQPSTPHGPSKPEMITGVPASPSATHEDEQDLQIVILQSQLAQVLAQAAKCEANGSQAAQVAQVANTKEQALRKSLAARGLMIDPQTSTIVPAPVAPSASSKATAP